MSSRRVLRPRIRSGAGPEVSKDVLPDVPFRLREAAGGLWPSADASDVPAFGFSPVAHDFHAAVQSAISAPLTCTSRITSSTNAGETGGNVSRMCHHSAWNPGVEPCDLRCPRIDAYWPSPIIPP